MNHRSFRRIVIEILFIFFLSLTPLLWFRPGAVMLGHDNTAPLLPKIFFEGRLSTWTPQFYGQSQVLILGTIPIHFLDAIPSYLGFSVEDSEKIVYVTWFFLIGLSVYILASVIRPRSTVFKLLATFFYQFNFFILQAWWVGEKSKFSAYIATPLILTTFLLVESGRMSVVAATIINSFIFFVFNAGGLYGLPLYGGAFVTVGCFMVYFIVENIFTRDWHAIKRIILLFIGTIALTVLANSYLFFPAYMKLHAGSTSGLAQVGGVSGIVSWASEISANASFTNLMRLQGIAEWYDNAEHPYAKLFLANPILIGVSFLWPLLTFLSLARARKQSSQRLVYFFFMVYLVSLFFAAGTHPPLGFLYQVFIEKVPGFFIFRSPYYKFAMSIFLASAILMAFTIDSLPQRFRRVVFILILAVIFGYHFPYFTGNFFQWRKGFSTRLTVPSYITQFGQWLNGERSETRVLLLPPNSPNLQYSLYQWGYLSFQAVPTLFSNASVIVNNDRLNAQESALTDVLYDAIVKGDASRVKKLLSLLSISHVLLQHDMVTNVESSIALGSSLYAKGLVQTGLFSLEKHFGAWDVYKVAGQRSPGTIYLAKPTVVDGTIGDADIVLPFLDEPNDFVFKDDARSITTSPAIIVPKCLTCIKKNKPIVTFPERNILPSDPFYALVLFFERLRPQPRDPKSAIYAALGTSLKRVSEINELLFQQKTLTTEVVDRYVQLLHNIEENFGRLTSQQDTIDVASDIRHYLRQERNYLRPNIGKYVTGGSQTVLAGIIFSEIHQTENKLESFAAPLEEDNSRFYQFNLDQSGEFRILIQKDDLGPFLNEKNGVTVVIDNERELKMDTISPPDPQWISFGSVFFKYGFHLLRLNFPPKVHVSYTLGPIDTEFSVTHENSCFGTHIQNVTSSKLYNAEITYLNDFSDNLLLFMWETHDGKPRLVTAAKLPASTLEDKTEQVIEVSPNVSELTMGLCAPNLSQERTQKQFKFSMSEVIDPKVVMSAVNAKPGTVSSIAYKRDSPTAYRVDLPADLSFPVVLVFSQRFDPWWELKGAPARHISVNGYANGWEIDAPVTHPITIAYKGEYYLKLGVMISAVTLVSGGIFLVLYWKHKKQKI